MGTIFNSTTSDKFIQFLAGNDPSGNNENFTKLGIFDFNPSSPVLPSAPNRNYTFLK